MSRFLTIALVLCVLIDGARTAMTWDDDDFFSNCPSQWCSQHGPEIRFPFYLESSNKSSLCGAPCTNLECAGEDTVLVRSPLASYKVTAIDYRSGTLTIAPPLNSSSCHLINILNSATSDTCYRVHNAFGSIVSCSRKITPSSSAFSNIFGPISCRSNTTQFSYLVDATADMSILPLDCMVASDGRIPWPFVMGYRYYIGEFMKLAEQLVSVTEMTVYWGRYGTIYDNCSSCEHNGERCAFSSKMKQTFCMQQVHGSHVKLIAGTSSAAALVVLLLMVATTLYFSLKTRYNEEIHLKVELFLKAYGTSKPTRYTFSEIKKIAKRFKERVGQGGFGSVYKGELPNGVPVAVKMLENSAGDGEDIINEVATIGLIHHANIVHLLGFCLKEQDVL